MRGFWFYTTAAILLLAACGDFTTTRAESTWPQFRGPDGQGHSAATGLPLEWDESTNVVWKTPIEGQGWSSPVVANGKIWLTSATEVKASEAESRERTKNAKGNQPLAVARSITLWANEVSFQTGELLRRIKLLEVEAPQAIHALNSFASPTPVLHAGRLYCHFGDYGTVCLDTSIGKVVWKNRLPLEHGVGPGSSPVLVDDLLILTCDGMDQQYVVALNSTDGEIVWRTERPPIRVEDGDMRKSYCTPLLIQVESKDQLIIPGAQWFIAYEPRTGKEIWRMDHGRGFSIVPRPVFDGRHVYLCTGFATHALWAIRPDGRGDVTDTHVDWKQSKQIPTMPSPVIVGNRIYLVSDGGVAQCFDTATGDVVWKKRIGGKFSASPLYADGRIYLCSHDGLTTVIAPGDEFRELAENQLDGQLMASPVVVDNDLLLRTDTSLYRIGD